MKNKSILSLIVFLLGLSVTTTSCEDMLTPDMNRYSEGFSGKDTVYFYLGILRNVQDMVEQNQLLGDLRSDLVTTTQYTQDSVKSIIEFQRENEENASNALLNRAAYYKVINQCNYYLSKVDTLAAKNQVKYMLPEYAQVLNIRAWTYLQLVHTYGRVPFITEPVDNADTGWETNPTGGFATADNLVDLVKDDLLKAYSIERSSKGYPEYGTFPSGNSDFSPSYKKFCFYSPLILADLYLLRGASSADYTNAAQYYFTFINMMNNTGGTINTKSIQQLSSTAIASYSLEIVGEENDSIYTPSVSSWVTNVAPLTTLNDEVLTVIPSAANSTFGRVLTNVPSIYGYQAHSTNTTTSAADGTISSGDGKSGEVSLSANYKLRQVQPSAAYVNLNKSLNYSHYNSGELKLETFQSGDARLNGTAPYLWASDGNKYRFISKDAPVSNVSGVDGIAGNYGFKHYRTLYRLTQVYLRYVEALNRAGYPRLAYAALRNGLNYKTFEGYTTYSYVDSIATPTVEKPDSFTKDTVLLGMLVKDPASTTVGEDADPTHYMGLYETYDYFNNKASLLGDWSSSKWTSNIGLHTYGQGGSHYISSGLQGAYDVDSLTSYEEVVSQRIVDENSRNSALDYTGLSKEQIKKILASESAKDTLKILAPTKEGFDHTSEFEKWTAEINNTGSERYLLHQQEINAVETLIADELALETAYEGTRMFDLIRIARHKNAVSAGDASDGNKWLAWKISRRDLDLKPYEQPARTGSLYQTLLNDEYWYIPNPE